MTTVAVGFGIVIAGSASARSFPRSPIATRNRSRKRRGAFPHRPRSRRSRHSPSSSDGDPGTAPQTHAEAARDDRCDADAGSDADARYDTDERREPVRRGKPDDGGACALAPASRDDARDRGRDAATRDGGSGGRHDAARATANAAAAACEPDARTDAYGTPEPAGTPVATPLPFVPVSTTAPASESGFAQTAAGVVRRYLNAVIAGDASAASGFLDARAGGVAESRYLDAGAKVTGIHTRATGTGMAHVEADITTSKGTYFATYDVAQAGAGAKITQHEIIKP